MILEQNGKTTVLWSAGANGWWFLDNDQPTETAVEALRYTLAEAGGILFMPNSAPILEEYFNQVWSYWWVLVIVLFYLSCYLLMKSGLFRIKQEFRWLCHMHWSFGKRCKIGKDIPEGRKGIGKECKVFGGKGGACRCKGREDLPLDS